MKYPDDFLKLRSGPSPLGNSSKRAMDVVDSPFLTKVSGNTVTRKKDQFTETRSIHGSPVMTGVVRTGNDLSLAYVELTGAGRTTRRNTRLVRYFAWGTAPPSLTRGDMVYIGDGLLLSMFNNVNDIGDVTADYEEIVHWPMTMPVNAPVKQRLLGEPVELARAVSYIDSIQVTGLLPYNHDFGLHATGWDNDSSRYRFGFSFTYYTDGSTEQAAMSSRVPMFYAGNTGDMALNQVPVPFYPGRSHPGSKVFVIGNGRLQRLSFVTEVAEADLDTAPIIYPYFANSSDHGQTWTSASTEFLHPFLHVHPATVDHREFLNNTQMGRMQDNHLNVYLGNGKSMLIIPNGVTELSAGGDLLKTCAMAFLGNEGSGYSRISWPPDAWEFSGSGKTVGEPDLPNEESHVRMFRQSKDWYSAQYAFGVGCMYIPVKVDGHGKFLITYDFGENWVIKDYPVRPADNDTHLATEYGTVIRPYVSESDPGEIVFASPRYSGNGRIDFLRTDGLFNEFRKTAGRLNYPDPLESMPAELFFQMVEPNQHFTYFGGPGYINPAFPKEFDQP